MKKQSGVTLIELLVTVAVISVIALLAIPSFDSIIEKNRLRNAVEDVYGLMVEARSEAVLRSVDSLMDIDESAAWCVGYTMDDDGLGTDCDCTDGLADSDPCSVGVSGTAVLKTIRSTDFPGVTMDTVATTATNPEFDSVRGTVGTAGAIQLQSGDWAANVVVSPLGRVMVCTPADEETIGFEDCPP